MFDGILGFFLSCEKVDDLIMECKLILKNVGIFVNGFGKKMVI